MLTIRTQTSVLCRAMSRRDALRLSLGGGLACCGPLAALHGLAGSARSADAAPDRGPAFGRAKSCIFIYLYGGPSHLDIWDLKPEAPVDVRGEFRPIDTNVPGLALVEHLPLLATRADRLAVVRSLNHSSSSHGSAGHQMLTGQAVEKQGEIAPRDDDAPHLGATVAERLGARDGTPPFVAVPWRITTQINVIPGQNGGFLGRGRDPVLVQSDDPEGRKFLLPEPGKLANAVVLDRETDATRDRYGRNVFGQSLLLARRLTQAGVRVVTVYWPDRKDEIALNYNGKRQPVSVPMWDTHGTKTGDTANFPSLKNRLLPPLDLASSALLDDLASEGRLDETLVVWTGEFGRTPKIQGDGRNHYSGCFSSMLAGGGIRGGFVHGASDATGATPTRDPVSPGDFFATLHHLLGVPADSAAQDATGKSRPLVAGKPVRALFGA